MKRFGITIYKQGAEKYTFPMQCVKTDTIRDDFTYVCVGDDIVMLFPEHNNVIRNANTFLQMEPTKDRLPMATLMEMTVIIPELRDYEIFEYVVSAYTFINGHKIVLGSYEMNMMDNIATEKPILYNNIRFFEQQTFVIPNPFEIIYSDSWKPFRESICGEISGTNNSESLINFEISARNNGYVPPQYKNGYASVPINDLDNSLRLDINYDEFCNIIPKIIYNDVFENDFQTYMSETYGLNDIYSNYDVSLSLVLKDNDNIYKFVTKSISSNDDILNSFFDKTELSLNWNDWRIGMQFVMSLDIADSNENEIFSLISEQLPVLVENFAYIVAKPEKINLKYVNMNNIQMDIVNKIEKHIMTVNKISDDNSNIINNVFVISNPIEDLVVYPNITQNIVLQLNGYKNKVTTFYLKIEDSIFSEIGRIHQGVIFKITGSNLSNKTQSGTYFILNENKELVTTGKYTYKF